MSVTGPSYNINAINKLSELELKQCLHEDQSWHHQYKDDCYVFVGGIPFQMNEGDAAAVFSQFGELIDIRFVRDKKTGAFKGYGFIGYVNQKSTILAVDNFNGYELLGRRLRVDHCKGFRPPKRKKDNEEVYKPSGAEGAGFRVVGVTPTAKKLLNHSTASQQTSLKQNSPLLICDPDEKWAKDFEEQLKNHQDDHKESFISSFNPSQDFSHPPNNSTLDHWTSSRSPPRSSRLNPAKDNLSTTPSVRRFSKNNPKAEQDLNVSLARRKSEGKDLTKVVPFVHSTTEKNTSHRPSGSTHRQEELPYSKRGSRDAKDGVQKPYRGSSASTSSRAIRKRRPPSHQQEMSGSKHSRIPSTYKRTFSSTHSPSPFSIHSRRDDYSPKTKTIA